MQNLVQTRKIGFLDRDYLGMSLKPNTDSFTDSSSDHLFMVNVKVLLNFEGNLSKMYIENRHFT